MKVTLLFLKHIFFSLDSFKLDIMGKRSFFIKDLFAEVTYKDIQCSVRQHADASLESLEQKFFFSRIVAVGLLSERNPCGKCSGILSGKQCLE